MLGSNLANSLVGQEMFAILDRALNIERGGQKVFHLELGDPALPAQEKIINETIEGLRGGAWHYGSSAGNLDFRNSLANFNNFFFDSKIVGENIVVAPANFFITAFLSLVCDKGDRVLLITPCFPTYIASASMLGLEIVEYATGPENGYIPKEPIFDLIKKVKPKAIIVNSANNPTGSLYSEGFLEDLVIAAKNAGSWVLSDETYGLISYDNKYYSLINSDYDKLVVLSSLSKIFSIPGLRVGYCISRSSIFIGWLVKYLSTTISCIPPFIQVGCTEYLSDLKGVSNDIQAVNTLYAKRCNFIFDEIPSLSHLVLRPKSAFYLFLPLPNHIDGKIFSVDLINSSHVAVTPGVSFGNDFKSYVRATFCGADEDVIEGIKRVSSAILNLKKL